MRCANNLQDFIAKPYRRYFLWPSYLIWCWSKVLCGTVIRQEPSGAELDQLFEIWDLVNQPGVGAVTDLRGLGSLMAPSFSRVQSYVASRAENLAHIRHALLVSPTQTGAAALGLMALSAPGWRAYQTAEDAFLWASATDGQAACPEVARLIESVQAEPPVVSRLRAALLKGARTLRSAALVLGTSERALQRSLQAVNTSFRSLKAEVLGPKSKGDQ